MIFIKRVVLLLIGILLITGCGVNKSDTLKSFKDYNAKKESYELIGTMKIISNEDEFTYDINIGVENNKHYKVSLTNNINNHEQVILKNDEGVYVVTPELNKSFKFMSEWPNNSSQAYLIETLVNDVNKDANASVKDTENGYEITSKVNYPNNQKLDHEVITTDKDFNIKRVEVKDVDENAIIVVDVNKLNYKPSFSNSYFELDALVKEESTTKKPEEDKNKYDEECLASCTDTEKNCKNTCMIESTSNILEDIIYPLYVPTDTYLSSKDTVSTDNGNRVILTFSGVDPFILVEEVSNEYDEMNIIPVNGEPLFLGSTIGAISENSIYWTSNGVDYYLTSKTLDASEMLTIAESVQNSSNLVAGLK
ncbi:MAG: outer membrane lipoprotein carrier protein LolA [Erysipelotrichales bacterium]|nr:outer membrane lipoprotein carrier protein LolA [Erysipelotrichales bacterium]